MMMVGFGPFDRPPHRNPIGWYTPGSAGAAWGAMQGVVQLTFAQALREHPALRERQALCELLWHLCNTNCPTTAAPTDTTATATATAQRTSPPVTVQQLPKLPQQLTPQLTQQLTQLPQQLPPRSGRAHRHCAAPGRFARQGRP
jgi:hypothetical protein